jgi:transposase
MEYELLDDELWEIIRPLLPVPRRRKTYPGRMPLDDRRVLTGILFVLRTGIRWDRLPADMGCGSGATCWRRWRQWQELGVWAELHKILLTRMHGVERLNYLRTGEDH